MKIGIPKEIKVNEARVGLIPASAAEVVRHGHIVFVEAGAGLRIGFSDADYKQAGAQILKTAEEVFSQAEMIVKVKEPQESERQRLRPGQILFTYLHLAPDMPQAQGLLKSGATCIAYETVTSKSGGLPLLTPMSEVAGRMATQVAAHYLEQPVGGRGMLLGGVPGVPPADVVILGAGVAGTHAAKVAAGMGANVCLVDRSLDVLRRVSAEFGNEVRTVYSTQDAIDRLVVNADAVIGTVLVVGAAAPKLVTAAMVKRMRKGAVLVDVSIDQGGCFETSTATTHADPVYTIDGVTHYCVANMPGGVPRTSTFALNNATLPFVLDLANKGWRRAVTEDPHLRNGLNIHSGKVIHPVVAEALKLPAAALDDAA